MKYSNPWKDRYPIGSALTRTFGKIDPKEFMIYRRKDLITDLRRMLETGANPKAVEQWGFDQFLSEDITPEPKDEDLIQAVLSDVANMDVHGQERVLTSLPYILKALEREESPELILKWLTIFSNVRQVKELVTKNTQEIIPSHDFKKAMLRCNLDKKLFQILLQQEGSKAWRDLLEVLDNPDHLISFLRVLYQERTQIQ